MSHKSFCNIYSFKLGCYAPIFHAFKTTGQNFQAHLHCFIFSPLVNSHLHSQGYFFSSCSPPFSFVEFNSFYLVVLFMLTLALCSCFITSILLYFLFLCYEDPIFLLYLSKLSTMFFCLLHYMNVHIVHCAIDELILSATFLTYDEFFEN